MKLVDYSTRAALPGVALLGALLLAVAFAACGQEQEPTPCGVLCEEEFWASAGKAEVEAELERNPDLSETTGELGVSALNMAAAYATDPALVTLLLDAGADIGIRSDLNYSTPLHMGAGFNQHPAVLDVLLDHGADIEARNNSGATPLHVAVAMNPNRDVVLRLLSRGADFSARTGAGAGILHTAAFNRDPSRLALVLEHGGASAINFRSDIGRTALHTAARHNPNPDVHGMLLSHGAEISATDSEGMTPLHSAAHRNPAPRGVIALLIEHGADVAAVNNAGQTPCQLATGRGAAAEVVRLLCG